MSNIHTSYSAIIDANGQVWTNFQKLQERFSTSASTAAFQEFIVCNMGFVHLRVASRHVEISLRPALVSGPTLGALMFMLEDAPALPCTAIAFDNVSGKRHIILPAGSARVAMLGQIVRAAKSPDEAVVKRWNLKNEQLPAVASLVEALRDWSACDGSYTELDLARLVAKNLRARFIRLQTDDLGQTFILHSVGCGLPKFAHDTLRPLVGKSFDEQPDKAHARACAHAYSSIVKLWSPVLEGVETSAYWPGHGRLLRRYARLILPLRVPKSGIGVLSASISFIPNDFHREAV